MQRASSAPHRGRSLLVLLGAALILGATTQCRMVTDNVTRPREQAVTASNCISKCSKAANEEIRAESERHVEAVHACKEQGSKPECLQREEERHQAAVQAIQDRRRRCQNQCHHQGGGDGR